MQENVQEREYFIYLAGAGCALALHMIFFFLSFLLLLVVVGSLDVCLCVCVWERHETRCGMVVVEVGIYIKHTEFGQILSVSRPQRMVQHWNILPEKEDNIFGGRWRIFACFFFVLWTKWKKNKFLFCEIGGSELQWIRNCLLLGGARIYFAAAGKQTWISNHEVNTING